MTDAQLSALLFLQLGVILLVCGLVGLCAVRIGQPQVVAEMKLILLNIGLQRGLITPTFFTILAMMAIGTTLMATLVFNFIYRHEPAVSPDSILAHENA